MKRRGFGTVKETIKIGKRQQTEWGKDLCLHGIVWVSLTKQYIDHKKKTTILKRELNRVLKTTNDKEMLLKCSTSLAIIETQNKTTLRIHLTPIRMAEIKTSNADMGVE